MRQLALAALCCIVTQPAFAQVGWSTYSNPRFGFVVGYPDIFSRQDAAPENGDGQVFRTPDGSALLTVYGSYSVDVLKQTNAEAMAAAKEEGVTYTYQQLLPNGFALSGSKGGRIVYERCVIFRPRIGCALLEYPKAQARQWHAIVTRMSQSIRLLKE